MGPDVYEKVFDLAKRRGFVYPAYELYGGAAGFYDYGPLGAQLKAHLEDLFRRIYVVGEGAAEISTPAITVEPVLKASGHVDHFSDVVISCKKCGSGYRADHFLVEEMERILARVEKAAAPDPFKAGARQNLRSLIDRIKEKPNVESAELIRRTQIEMVGDAVVAHHDRDSFRVRAGGVDEPMRCPACQSNEFSPAANFNLMFKTHVGPGSSKVAYMRPETAQAMFVDFTHLYRFFREKLPFAACQIGRAYRNEIAPRQGLIRLREFGQMEVEAFYDPKALKHPSFGRSKGTPLNLVPNTTQKMETMTAGDAVRKKIIHNAALAYHLILVQRLLTSAGVDPKRLRFRQHLKDEMAHYAKDCWDAEFESARFGWVECVGVAYRTDFDLRQHSNHSGKPLVALRRFDEPVTKEVTRVVALPAKLGPLFKKDAPRITEALTALDEASAQRAADAPHVEVELDGTTHRVPRDAFEIKRGPETVHGETFIPHVIEPSYGQDRILYAILEHSYSETKKEGEDYTVLRLPPAMAPVNVGVFPLMPKDGLDALAQRIQKKLRESGLRAYYDDSGAIGRRYARADEVGTPVCITVDYDSLKDKTVTLRDRDTTHQVRVKIGTLAREVRRRQEPARARPEVEPVRPG